MTSKKIKTTFINPPFLLEERYGKDLKQFGAASEPMGLAYMAANLEKHGYDVSIIDSPALGYDVLKTAQTARDQQAQLIGITMLTTMYSAVKRLTKAIKNQMPASKIVVGGAHATALPKETLTDIPEIDYVCVGEGEKTILELAECLDAQYDVSKVDGLIYRDRDNKIVTNNPRKFEMDLDKYPPPARHLLPMDRYRLTVSRVKDQSYCPTLIIARGCPFNCAFCSHPFGRSFRHHSINRIIEEIKELMNKHHVSQINFEADTLTVDKPFIISLCRALVDQGISESVKWTCTSRVDTVNEEVLRAMKSAGCWEISYGVESGVQRLLDLINKGETLKQIENVFTLTKKVGIKIRGFFMIGLPTETIEESWQTINFAKKLNPLWAQFTVTTPYPGTPLFEQLDKAGEIRHYNWENYNTWGGWAEKDMPFVPVGRSAKEIRNLQKKALISFYLRPRIILRFLKQIDSFKTLKKYFFGFLVLVKHKLNFFNIIEYRHSITREQIIIKYIKDKDVLDIGSVGQTKSYNLWGLLKKHAGQLTGIDTEPSKEANVVCANMENYDFGKQFEIIIAGDVLEHVDNQGLFLTNIKKHLKRDGFLILTTPNAKWPTVFLRPNPTHTLWHDRYTLFHILERNGFKTFFFKYYPGNKKYNFFKKILILKQAMLIVCQIKD